MLIRVKECCTTYPLAVVAVSAQGTIAPLTNSALTTKKFTPQSLYITPLFVDYMTVRFTPYTGAPLNGPNMQNTRASHESQLVQQHLQPAVVLPLHRL